MNGLPHHPPRLPPSFLTGKSISLRKADQKPKEIHLNNEGIPIDEEGFVIPPSQYTPRVFHHETPSIPNPPDFEFKPLPIEKRTKHLEEQRDRIKLDMSVKAGFPLFDAIALSEATDTPLIDWWDAPYVQLDDNDAPVLNSEGNWMIKEPELSNTFENASFVKVKKPIDHQMPDLMTKKQRMRLKKIKKLEKAKEERFMTKIGLKEPEVPIPKKGAMIPVDSFISPTEVDQKIKQAKEEKRRKHEEHNKANKLDKLEKKEKQLEKRKKDSMTNVRASVYKVEEFSEDIQYGKIMGMGNKWVAGGGIFQVKSPVMNFVVFEGGEKGTRKFQALMERRIDWKGRRETASEVKKVFEGVTLKRRFYNFRKYVFDVGTQCREFFKKYGAEDLFDAAARG